MYQNILVPIDVSHRRSGELGLRCAVKMAEVTGARLTLLSVISDVPNLVAVYLPDDYTGQAVAAAEQQLKDLASDCGLAEGSYDLRVRDGAPHHEILKEAKKRKADLIVLASHRPELADYLLGTVAAKVVRHAGCSVLVVRE